MVVWQSYRLGTSTFEISAQRFASDGARRGEEFQVNQATLLDQRFPDVSSDTDGNFAVTWQGDGARVQRFAEPRPRAAWP